MAGLGIREQFLGDPRLYPPWDFFEDTGLLQLLPATAVAARKEEDLQPDKATRLLYEELFGKCFATTIFRFFS